MLYANTQRFAHDTIDGETVIIDSTAGRLFLLTGFGPWIWQRMILGNTIEGLIGNVAARYGAEASRDVAAFLASLVANEMITSEPGDSQAANCDMNGDLPLPEAYTPPGLETYDDIADIIAMDPIHDVDPARGWPYR